MTSARPHMLSMRAQRVLEVIRDAGPLSGPSEGVLRDAAGTERGVFDSLLHLRGRNLVRWDDGGKRIRITRLGRTLLGQPFYRDRSHA